MAKTTILFMLLALILSASLSYAARPNPVEKNASVAADVGEVEVSCDGIGKEECLMRRTLAAHIDYIYTQDKP